MIFPTGILTCRQSCDVIMTSCQWPVWPKQAFPREWAISHEQSVLKVLRLSTISNGWAPPDGFMRPASGRTLLKGPSHNGLMPIWCLWGMAAFSSFPKALFHFPIFRMLGFPKWHTPLATLLQLPWHFNLFALGHLQTVPRSLDSPGCWNGRFNMTISQTHWLVSQERLSPRARTPVFIDLFPITPSIDLFPIMPSGEWWF